MIRRSRRGQGSESLESDGGQKRGRRRMKRLPATDGKTFAAGWRPWREMLHTPPGLTRISATRGPDAGGQRKKKTAEVFGGETSAGDGKDCSGGEQSNGASKNLEENESHGCRSVPPAGMARTHTSDDRGRGFVLRNYGDHRTCSPGSARRWAKPVEHIRHSQPHRLAGGPGSDSMSKLIAMPLDACDLLVARIR